MLQQFHRLSEETDSENCSDYRLTRLIGAILLEQSDEWATQRPCYMALETIGPTSENPTVNLPTVVA